MKRESSKVSSTNPLHSELGNNVRSSSTKKFRTKSTKRANSQGNKFSRNSSKRTKSKESSVTRHCLMSYGKIKNNS